MWLSHAELPSHTDFFLAQSFLLPEGHMTWDQAVNLGLQLEESLSVMQFSRDERSLPEADRTLDVPPDPLLQWQQGLRLPEATSDPHRDSSCVLFRPYRSTLLGAASGGWGVVRGMWRCRHDRAPLWRAQRMPEDWKWTHAPGNQERQCVCVRVCVFTGMWWQFGSMTPNICYCFNWIFEC